MEGCSSLSLSSSFSFSSSESSHISIIMREKGDFNLPEGFFFNSVFIAGRRIASKDGRFQGTKGSFVISDPGSWRRYILYFIPDEGPKSGVIVVDKSFCICMLKISNYNEEQEIQLAGCGVYYGPLKDGQPDGQGELLYDQDKSKYIGGFVQGRKHGFGVFIDKLHPENSKTGHWEHDVFIEEMECEVCENAPPVDPVIVGDCGHTLCRKCAEKWKKTSPHKDCPKCRGTLFDNFIPNFYMNEKEYNNKTK